MRRRRLTVLILLFLALALSGGAIFIANELAKQSTAANDAKADNTFICSGGKCDNGATFEQDCTYFSSDCTARGNAYCSSIGRKFASLNASNSCAPANNGGNQPPATGGVPANCQPYPKVAGQECNPGCGDLACDGSGPLGCNTCSNDGKSRCTLNPNLNKAAYNQACGIVVGDNPAPTVCSDDSSTSSAAVCRGQAINTNIDGVCRCTFVGTIGSGATAKANCACVAITQPPTTGGNTGGGTNTQGGGTGTTADGASCTTTAQCRPGAYCQGRENARKCQRPAPNQCPGNGTCTGYLAFKCTKLSATGECLDNPQTVASLAAGMAYSAGCGQVDQVCVGGDRNRQLCGEFIVQDNSCQPTIIVQQPICGSSCSNNSQCPTGMLCSGGSCTKPECVGNVCGPDAKCGTPIICGGNCNNNGQCPGGQTCSAGTCVLNTCLTPGNCTGNCQPNVCGNGVVNPGEQCNEPGLTCSASSTCNTSTCLCEAGRCGGTCTTDSQCPSGNTCNGGTCKLDFCLEGAGNCAADNCTPIGCGDQCAPGGLCPNGHTCQNGRCANNACLDGNCDADGCIALPRTNLFAPENRILLSMILIFMGVLIYKSGVSSRVVNYLNANLVNRRDTKKKKFEEELS